MAVIAFNPTETGTLETIVEKYTLQVNLTPDSPEKYNLVAKLFYEGDLDGKPVILAVHGITYTGEGYFNFKGENEEFIDYSFVEYAVKNGFVVCVVDRIGNGESDKPDPLKVTLQATTFTLHQVADALRNGVFGGHKFTKIGGLGHSYGSFSLAELAANLKFKDDLDSVILTGYSHNVNLRSFAAILKTLGIRFARSIKKYKSLSLGYLTIIGEGRRALFYDENLADPRVIEQDNVQRDVFSITTMIDIIRAILSKNTRKINVPVKIMIGEKDLIFCGGLVPPEKMLEHEQNYFGPEAFLEVDVLPGGHDLNLEKNHPELFKRIVEWFNKKFEP